MRLTQAFSNPSGSADVLAESTFDLALSTLERALTSRTELTFDHPVNCIDLENSAYPPGAQPASHLRSFDHLWSNQTISIAPKTKRGGIHELCTPVWHALISRRKFRPQIWSSCRSTRCVCAEKFLTSTTKISGSKAGSYLKRIHVCTGEKQRRTRPGKSMAHSAKAAMWWKGFPE